MLAEEERKRPETEGRRGEQSWVGFQSREFGTKDGDAAGICGDG